MKTIFREKERIIVYIDGFNFYFGLLEAGYEKYKWVNYKQLVEKFYINIRYYMT